MDDGAQFVMTCGAMLMLMWPVDSLDIVIQASSNN